MLSWAGPATSGIPRCPLFPIGPAAEPTSCQDGAEYWVENPPPDRFQAGSLSRPVTWPRAFSLTTGAVPPTARTYGEEAGNSGTGPPVHPTFAVPPVSPEAARTVVPRDWASA